MNRFPINTARDADLRLSLQALERAARRARELAARTGTAIVVSRDGVLEHIRPPLESDEIPVQDVPARNGDPR
jgi:hypothetical protein